MGGIAAPRRLRRGVPPRSHRRPPNARFDARWRRAARASRPRPPASSSSALLDSDDDDVPALSDTAATLQLLFQQCPPAAAQTRCRSPLSRSCTQSCATAPGLIERSRSAVRMARCASSAPVPRRAASRTRRRLRRRARDGGRGRTNAADRRVLDEARRRALPACTAVRVKSADLSAALGAGRGGTVAGALLRLGWILPAQQACERAGRGAPTRGRRWRWTLPRCGAMVLQLVAARTSCSACSTAGALGARSARSSRPRLRRAPPRRRCLWLRPARPAGQRARERARGRRRCRPLQAAAGKQAAERVARKRRR